MEDICGIHGTLLDKDGNCPKCLEENNKRASQYNGLVHKTTDFEVRVRFFPKPQNNKRKLHQNNLKKFDY